MRYLYLSIPIQFESLQEPILCMLCSIQFDYARDAELVNVVRKDLAMALKALFQHGLVRVSVKGEQQSFQGLHCHK